MKKEKFIIKDILTNKKKLDRRYYLVQRFKQFVAALVLGAILGALFGCYISSGGSISIGYPNALEQPIEVQAIEFKPFCKDPISCIRDIGEEQGRSNKTIMTMIRIAQKESMCRTEWKNGGTCVPTNGISGIGVDPRAKNPKSSARGLFQIIAGTWYSNDCVGDKYDYKDNTICAYKILDGQGLRAWEVCNNGSAQCF